MFLLFFGHIFQVTKYFACLSWHTQFYQYSSCEHTFQVLHADWHMIDAIYTSIVVSARPLHFSQCNLRLREVFSSCLPFSQVYSKLIISWNLRPFWLKPQHPAHIRLFWMETQDLTVSSVVLFMERSSFLLSSPLLSSTPLLSSPFPLLSFPSPLLSWKKESFRNGLDDGSW